MRPGLPAMALLLVVPALAQEAEQRWDVPLAECPLQGGRLIGGAIVPRASYALQAGQPLRMEAERAGDVRGPVETVEEQGASGGRYLQVPNGTYQGTGAAAVLAVSVPAEGAYRFWVRTFWPDIGANSFFLGLDDQPEQIFGNTEGPDVIGKWHWLAGPEWKLAAGEHRVTVHWREDGTQLDLAVLAAADYQPSDAADALAVAICHIHQRHVERLLAGSK